MHVKYVGLHTSIHMYIYALEYISNLHKHLSDRNPEHFISLISHHAEKFNTNSFHLLVPGADIQYMIFYSKTTAAAAVTWGDVWQIFCPVTRPSSLSSTRHKHTQTNNDEISASAYTHMTSSEHKHAPYEAEKLWDGISNRISHEKLKGIVHTKMKILSSSPYDVYVWCSVFVLGWPFNILSRVYRWKIAFWANSSTFTVMFINVHCPCN